MIKEVIGFIMSEVPYGETSKIINVITKDGMIGIMCKGAKSLKSKNRSTTLRFTYAKFNIYYKENKLSTLIDSEIINDLSLIKNDIILISYLNYLTELTSQVIKDNFDSSIYDLFITAIEKINNNLNPMVITNILEIKYLDYLGVSLNLDCCNICGSKEKIVTIDGDVGGLVCQNCYHNEKIVSLKNIQMLRNYYYLDISKISKIDIEENIIKEINNFINIYYDRYTGLYLNSKKFLRDII